jgi:hypothetical protein
MAQVDQVGISKATLPWLAVWHSAPVKSLVSNSLTIGQYAAVLRLSQNGTFQPSGGGQFLKPHLCVCKTRKRNAIY